MPHHAAATFSPPKIRHRNYERSFMLPFDANDRHPLDKVYACGFDPFGKSLRVCAEHWKGCKNPACERVYEFHLWLGKYLAERNGARR